MKQKYFRERLKLLELEEHDAYINHVAADLKRELRICRDVYRDYLLTVNKKSITAKASAALDLAVPQMASRRLREEIIVYVRHVGVDDLMFAALYCRVMDRLVRYPNFDPEWLGIKRIISGLVPDSVFQDLSKPHLAR